jgi:hypothetical protein
MSTLADRLRGIVAAIPASRPPAPASRRDVIPLDDTEGGNAHAAPAKASRTREAADVLDGEWVATAGGQVLVVDRVYRAGYRHGRATLMDNVIPEPGEWCRPYLGGAGAANATPVSPESTGRSLFVDLETTGLAGGAGTYAFLVGCAWFEGCQFRIRQLFLSSLGVERAMLDLLAELAGQAHLVVSFNGKSFDLPLIETRYLFHRRQTPFSSLPHLDMLHPARRLWRRSGDSSEDPGGTSCRLSTLEAAICGHVREGDVPGFEIPSRYFHYVRTGDARPLATVFEHNRLDLLSLAFLTARAAQLATDGPPSLRSAREAVGLGQLFERTGDGRRARQCFARAAGFDAAAPLAGDEETRAEAVHAYASLCRRERRYVDAARAWRQLLDMRRAPARLVREASEALAVHHEHRLRDPRTARAFALRSAPLQETATRRQALQHRLARLERKLVARPLSLF